MLRPIYRLAAVGCLALATFAGFRAIEAAYAGTLHGGRFRHRPSARLGEMVGAVPLTEGVKLIHRFRVDDDHWTAFQVRTVTWDHKHRPGRCLWVLYELGDGERREVRRGRFRAADVVDWGHLAQRFAEVPDSGGRTYELVFSAADTPLMESVGLAVHRTNGGEVATIVRDARPNGEPLNLAAGVEHPGIGPSLTLIHCRAED